MLACLAIGLAAFAPTANPLLAGSRREDKAGWIYVKLKGTPEQLGFQQGYWLAAEIDDLIKVDKLNDAHESKADPEAFFRKNREVAMKLLWPKIPDEYQKELEGITKGVKAHGYPYTLADIVMNAGDTDMGYYNDWLAHKKNVKLASTAADHCSAFVATGSATKDGKIVMAHTCWSDYPSGERNNIIFDIEPAKGQRILMDSFPGHLDSGDDFAINSKGIMLTETTISNFVGFDPSGVPEFVRMREAIQYGTNIDEVNHWFVDKNNGAYANMWLIGDRKTNEIASLELGLKNTILHRTIDGAITSCNVAIDPKLAAEECMPKVGEVPHPSRTARWQFLMDRDKGKIDAELGKTYISDHYDPIAKTSAPTAGSLCGHGDGDEGAKFDDEGSVQGKVVTSDLCNRMTFWARMGHPCGESFYAAAYLTAHPDHNWQRPILRDMLTQPWVTFASDSHTIKP
jgi:hypothetical protein